MTQLSKKHEGVVVSVEYTDVKDVVTSRDIIPTSIPTDTIKVLDVSGLDAADQERIALLYREYKEYYKTVVSTIYKFEDYVNLANPDCEVANFIKWRSLKANSITLRD